MPADLSGVRLETDRLLLRPLRAGDAGPIQQLLNNLNVLRGLLRPPYPYTLRDATAFIGAAQEGRLSGYWLSCAIELKAERALIGMIGLDYQDEYKRGNIGYWLGEPYWNRGYATEALRVLIDFGFEHMALIRIQANHFTDNPASGRVMQKAGMTYEGTLRHYFIRFDEPKDAAFYSILRAEWDAR